MIAADAPTHLLEAANPAISPYLPIDIGRRDVRAPDAPLRQMIEVLGQVLAELGSAEALVAHDLPDGDDDDLLNLAGVLALRGDGGAFTRACTDHMPRQTPVVATLRY
ncbi:conserved protein of unknown function [Rhodovastum atsumiense]|uniref:Uncharacterized protein n=1 Tax=Rhodovastum atsumiense TaxID=504468 RepID=A0A5M6IXB3_9PROT|nr:hypothetical protein [Rhodovastum atsumiense]KAA5612487.1 hypothetical protein F1189_09970 [Rhodovastum atsumiense]CAH2600406.1 conserved protein of unknown function [Rhodovastum atsumiense]